MKATNGWNPARRTWAVVVLVVSALVALSLMAWRPGVGGAERQPQGEVDMSSTSNMTENLRQAIFAGGCFWCIEAAFELMPGVVEAVSGYTGGDVENPTYGQVIAGTTGHYEAVRVVYDPEQITYGQLLEQFWRSINPTDEGGQFYDRGSQYSTAIFYLDDEQRALAEASKQALESSGVFDEPIVTEILPAQAFWVAEEYHQDYYKKNLERYKGYAAASGREDYLEETWEGNDDVSLTSAKMPAWLSFTKPSEEELRELLTPLQYEVTQENGTEMSFSGEYWDNKAEGIYVDVVSGEPLFSSVDKYDFGTGWPSFIRPITPESVVTKTDTSLGMVRVEVRSRYADSHLGHLFEDSPLPSRTRYCINSAALRFIPKEQLAEEGYEEYLTQFETASSTTSP